MTSGKIDFVVTWVNGNDPDWIKEKDKYSTPGKKDNSESDNRFRDWNLMRYWFRGVEKYAPWVNNIYFVTCGHYPEWLNLDCPKLKMVSHSEYIPTELLPTFNSNTIELFLNRIKDLSEQFVLFNDDTFVISPTKPEDFFVDGMPCESAVLGIISSQNVNDVFPHIMINNSAVLNKHFVKKKVLKKQRNKFITIKYGREVIKNILLSPFVYFAQFWDYHLPSSHLKSVYDEVWNVEPEVLWNGAKSRFRSVYDVNHWLIKAWYMCKGNFIPRNPKWGKKYELGTDKGVYDYITKHKGKVVCLNDSDEKLDFDKYQILLSEAFEKILPEKSMFEK